MDRLLIPDAAILWVYIAGSGVYATGAVIFAAYRYAERGNRGHVMMSMAFTFLSMHHAILAVRNFRYWFSITETIALTRLALVFVLIFSALGFVSHLMYRRSVRNE